MEDAGQKSRTIASIARASSQRGDIDAAVSLFTLAFQEAMTLSKPDQKHAALSHLIVEQSRVGRLADAFKNAGVIRDRRAQANALLGMGKVLLAQKKMKEAIKLLDYIPYPGMRTQIFAPVALFYGKKGDKKKASALLAKALEPSKFKASPAELAKVLPMVIDVQSQVGVASMNAALFSRIEAQLDQLPDDTSKIEVLTGIANAEARAKRRDAALRALAGAWRISWLNRRNPKYPEILTNLMRAQIEVGELLQAFDTAARVPDGPTPKKPKGQLEASLNARNLALQRVAVAAAREGMQRLSLRAARRIRNTGARARVYAAIAQAFPTGIIESVAPSTTQNPASKAQNPGAEEKMEETGPKANAAPLGAPPGASPGASKDKAAQKPPMKAATKATEPDSPATSQPAPKSGEQAGTKEQSTPNAPKSLLPKKN
ncbi:MAG: hypothetical protein O2912_08000 [Proteobacteria bacterium]|nr:hypothetical protein [Pseudomonadota bacterium]